MKNSHNFHITMYVEYFKFKIIKTRSIWRQKYLSISKYPNQSTQIHWLISILLHNIHRSIFSRQLQFNYSFIPYSIFKIEEIPRRLLGVLLEKFISTNLRRISPLTKMKSPFSFHFVFGHSSLNEAWNKECRRRAIVTLDLPKN